jgi:phosphatidylglycerophosphatase A
VVLTATLGKVGFIPFIPGTLGTLVGIPLVIILSMFERWVWVILVVLLFFIGIWASHEAQRIFKVHDVREIVIDELVGYLVAMFGVPLTLFNIAFVLGLFRLIDILKPFPIVILDKKLKGGLGIMTDDIIAGLYSLVIFHLVGKGGMLWQVILG